ncbi:hypothetical protein BH11PSE2_BH11PSE2_20340 [soil metagenome]
MKIVAAALAAAAALLVSAAAPTTAPPSGGAVDVARLQNNTPAPTLAAYRLFTDAGARAPNAGLTPYGLNTPLFSDYAEKFRYVFLPNGAKAAWRDQGVLDFPVGTTLVKTFAYRADFRRPDESVRFIETRLLIHRKSGWVPLTYVWNADQTQAVLKRAGARVNVTFTDTKGEPVAFSYAVPNQNQCKECHALGRVLTPIGPKARNLNGEFAYAEGPENQLAHWVKAGMIKGAPDLRSVPATPRWNDPATPVADRARAYLDGNCAHCHNPKAAANNSGLFLDLEQSDPVALGVSRRTVAAGRASFDLDFDIVAGEPDRSIMLRRMASRDPGIMMPELSRTLVDEDGVALIRAYIASLAPAKAR